MADEKQVQEARNLGWVPKEEWKGESARWVDADVFLQRQEIVRGEREHLRSELSQRDAQIRSLGESLRAANAAISALEKSHDEDVKAQVEQARADLKAEIARASEADDHAAVAEATDKLTQLNAREALAEKDEGAREARTEQPAKTGPQIAPEMKAEIDAWEADNRPWISQTRNLRMMNLIAMELREKGDQRRGRVFMDAVKAEVEKELGQGPSREGDSKVGSGSGGGGRREQSSVNKGYADLPAEAKAICDRQAARLVGPNRAHKDIESWRKSYASQYFEGEQQ